MNSETLRRLNLFGLLCITLVLIVAFVLQVLWDELPCPLCLLQRLGFAAVLFGLLLNVAHGPRTRHHGVILIGALYGAAVALRQVSLHVIPGTPPYGSAILGFHFYTWAFVVFALIIVAVAALLLFSRDEAPAGRPLLTGFEKWACWLAIAVVGANALMTFLECGPFQCPDNPVGYWLLQRA